MKRMLSTLFALCLALSLTSAHAAVEITQPLGELPFVTEPVTLTILCAQDTLVEDMETNGFTKYIEENTGVDLTFELLPASGSEALNKISVMVASGQKLPDVINYTIPLETVSVLASSGAFLPLNDYIGACTPNLDAANLRFPEYELIRYSIASDGNIYALPIHASGIHDQVPSKLVMNTKWLETLGLEVPTTTEELYTVLKAFKEGDPNGNGQADEYPLVGSAGLDPALNLMNAFIYEDGDQHMLVQDGAIDVAYNKEAWREGLRYLNRLYQEELLAPISYTQDFTQQRTMVNNEGTCIVGAFVYMSQNMMATVSPYYNDFFIIPPLQGPEGVQYARYARGYPSCQWFVTKDCKDPELAVRVGDFMFTDEAYLLNRFGLEGEHYVLAKEGDVCCFEGFDPILMQTDAGINLWSEVQNVYWRNKCPGVVSNLVNSYVWNGDPLNGNWRIGQGASAYYKHRPAEGAYLPKLMYTEDETYELSDLKTTILSYADESKVRFITGDLSLDKDWDAYVAELDAMGLSDYLALIQTAYDRQVQ